MNKLDPARPLTFPSTELENEVHRSVVDFRIRIELLGGWVGGMDGRSRASSKVDESCEMLDQVDVDDSGSC